MAEFWYLASKTFERFDVLLARFFPIFCKPYSSHLEDSYATFKFCGWMYFKARWLYEPIIMFFSKDYTAHSLMCDAFGNGIKPTLHNKSECRLFCNSKTKYSIIKLRSTFTGQKYFHWW